MKMLKKTGAILLASLFFLQSAALADLISVNRKVGLKLDEDERDKYGLFEKENNYSYAVFIQLKDGTRTLNVVYNDGTTKTMLLTDEQFNAFNRHIEDFNPDRPPFVFRSEIYKKDGFMYALLSVISSGFIIGLSMLNFN